MQRPVRAWQFKKCNLIEVLTAKHKTYHQFGHPSNNRCLRRLLNSCNSIKNAVTKCTPKAWSFKLLMFGIYCGVPNGVRGRRKNSTSLFLPWMDSTYYWDRLRSDGGGLTTCHVCSIPHSILVKCGHLGKTGMSLAHFRETCICVYIYWIRFWFLSHMRYGSLSLFNDVSIVLAKILTHKRELSNNTYIDKYTETWIYVKFLRW
jgi:hypothetical protein